MATTVQVVENISVGNYVCIDGVRCEVEASTNELTITQSLGNAELLLVMANKLLEMNVIQRADDGQYYFVNSGKLLVPELTYED
ncbi:hypothetical protein OTK49_03115 [Vibrio coralliirubri]|uniref:hypothetical protein n=1 Tax=Vibrio coralliirubri TaxID=1516159 RepID=UPI002284F64D|nr:hypothetical protein [Vibrio coralliirubri]MCY9861506.1 hypothetical protein [Vibrio coralliirubri]